MATAARSNQGNYDTLWTNLLEHWLNENSFEDQVFTGTPTLALFLSQAKKKNLPNTLTVRLGESRGTGVDSFEYYDTLSTEAQKGTQAAKFKVANYAAPIGISDQEKLEMDTPEKIADHLEYVMDKQKNEMRERLGKDIFGGSTANSKNMEGLEQLLPGYTHFTTAGSAVTDGTADTDTVQQRHQMRQAANVYGGIQRVAWTDNDPQGTGWEGNSFNCFGDGTLGYSSGVPSGMLQRLMEVCAMSSWGTRKPNAMISSYAPYHDYEVAAMSTQQVTRGSGMLAANVSFENVMFKGMTWFWDDFCKTYNQIGNATAGSSNLYLIDTNATYLTIDPRWDFTLSDERKPMEQMSTVRHLLWRGQLVSEHPRSNARMYDY